MATTKFKSNNNFSWKSVGAGVNSTSLDAGAVSMTEDVNCCSNKNVTGILEGGLSPPHPPIPSHPTHPPAPSRIKAAR